MGMGSYGAFVISWAQTVIDGIAGAPASDLRAGATWRREGQAIRVDGCAGPAQLGVAFGMAELHERAAISARRMCAPVVPLAPIGGVDVGAEQLLDRGFVLTDGRKSYAASRIEPEPGRGALVLFLGMPPPPGRELWVVRLTTNPRVDARMERAPERGVICLAQGTRVATPAGPCPVEDLLPGDLVQTRDDGACAVLWRGARHLSHADLHRQPHLRPIRVAPEALGSRWHGPDLVVSPCHRLLLNERACQALFGAPEVLVRACDLLGRPGVTVDLAVESVTYVHLMLEQHQVLHAHGLGSESFHPDEADPMGMEATDLERLHETRPELASDPALYGAPARRRLSPAEAAILAADTGPIRAIA